MTTNTIPESAQNVRGNFRGFSSAPKRPLTEEERIQAEVDRYVVKTLALQNDDDLNSGQTDLVAFARFSCKTYHFCGRDKFLRNFVASRKNKRHISLGTARRYLRHAIKCGFILDMTDVHGNNILIADDKPARMEEMFREKTAEKTEAEAADLRVAQAAQERQRAEKLAFLNLGRRATEPVTPPTAEGPAADQPAAPEEAAQNFADRPENFTGGAKNIAGSLESFPASSGKDSREGGKTLPPVEMGIGGGISPGISAEGIKETTTTPTPAGPAGVEESAREDAARPGVVVVGTSTGEKEKTAGEGAQGHDPMDEDPFAEGMTPAFARL